ncbi:hypothetical protein RHSIM_Rhsim01G0171100 [Rhododendron simsii]|uniref:Copine C-terminal domain-containing protein n=1 Tax=Rhododendron simsii TaxID=118357 RepID=A0A834HFG2_RHOSS|nr:hypothetical protein RHSIM_Rhsim01G0171100 [Rhododendron simsii]
MNNIDLMKKSSSLYGINVASICFHGSFSNAYQQVEGVEGIMASYASALHNVTLVGPTLFGQVINTAAEIASHLISYNGSKYFVLLNITFFPIGLELASDHSTASCYDRRCEVSVTFGAKEMGTLEKYKRRLNKEWRPLGWSLELCYISANALMASIEEKSLDLEAKVHVTDAKLAEEADAMRSSLEVKEQELVALEENLDARERLERVEGVEGILASYASALHNVMLARPTLFGQVINTAAEIASRSLSYNSSKYFVLLIITV